MTTARTPRLSLNAAWLRYRDGFEVHTATSGRLVGLRAVYLTLDYGDVVGRSEVRTNIAYLTGLSQERLEVALAEGLASLTLSQDPRTDRNRIDTLIPDAPAGLRLLLEAALVDAAARRESCTVAAFLGDNAPICRVRTNQTLFIGEPEAMLARAAAYVARGFTDLKLRMGAGAPERDLENLRRLRDLFGDAVTLSADVNGQWDRQTARRYLPALAELGLDYLEQPLPAADLEGSLALAGEQATPIMLDESVTELAALARVASLADGLDGRLMVHLKLAKLGGLDRLITAVSCARAGGLGVMIGQMNEGALATAATVAVSVALAPDRAELYGADGLVDDPFTGLSYADGSVDVKGPIGFGVEPSRPLDPFIAGEQARA